MKFAVMGAGGVGGYLAARLGAAGQEVHVVARGAHLETMRSSGLKLLSERGDVHLNPVRATNDPAAVGPVDIVLFTVKMFDAEEAARAIAPMVGPQTAVLTFLNGVDSVDMLAAVHGRERVLGGTVYVFATIDAPGVIRHTGTLDRFLFGELDGTRTPRVERLGAAFAEAGIDGGPSDRILPEIWEKFVVLAANSGVTALTRSPVGPVRTHPLTRRLFIDAMREVEAVARAKGVAVAQDIVERQMAMFDRLPDGAKSSQQTDLERDRRLELPWLSGAVVRLGAEVGVPTPVHGFINSALILHAGGNAQRYD